MSPSLDETFRRIDAINAQDPRLEKFDGVEQPKELAYGRRMTRTLAAFEPEASEALRIAARGQHVGRFRVPRDRYPMTRAGYLEWRTALGAIHAEVLSEVLREVGYDEHTIARVGTLVQKRGLRRDAEVQVLEDVACLVFLEHYLEPFAAEHDDEKVSEILVKTWRKMSARGQKAAREWPLPEKAANLLDRALEGAR